MVADAIDLTGTAASFRTVDLVARVTGYLKSVNFEDGALVEKGQELFVIEPEPYEQQLRLAEAALLQAQSEYDRQVALMKENATSAANVEKWLSQRDQAKSQVELAKINLGYIRVAAPFSGRIGRRLCDPGNLVGPAGNAKLATIDQMEPINVYFNINERDALRIGASFRARGTKSSTEFLGKARVFVGVQTEEGYPHEGMLDFIDNGLDPSTGAVQMRAVFKNADHILFPGVFVRVHFPLDNPKPMLAVPNSAVDNDQEDDYVLVVEANDVVARRAVVKGPLLKSVCAIREGLTDGDRVVINGFMNVRPGSTVAVVNAVAH